MYICSFYGNHAPTDGEFENNLGGTMILISALVLLFVITPALNVNAASMEFYNTGTVCGIDIDGNIDKSTFPSLVKLYKSNTDQCSDKTIYLRLNSNGGDVEAAIKTGEFIRSNKFQTVVAQNAKCASACVFLLLGGVNRIVIGDIGLHRPFLNKYSNSTSESKSVYERNNRMILDYLRKMNITDSLLNTMNSVPPGQMRWLSVSDQKQLSELNLTGEDPVYADERDSTIAKKRKISKQEYYLREQKAEKVCADERQNFESNPSEYGKCFSDVMSGKR
jgi:hypothetical protein